MSESRILQLLITTGSNEEVLTVLEQERHPNELGEVTPPVTIEHDGVEYILKRQWMQDVYIYGPSHRRNIDDLLADTPV